MEQIVRLPLDREVTVDQKGANCAQITIPWGPRHHVWQVRVYVTINGPNRYLNEKATQVLFSSGPRSSYDFIFEASFEPLHASEGESDENRLRRKRLQDALRSCCLLNIFEALMQIQLEKEREVAIMATSHDSRLQFELSTLPLASGLKIAFVSGEGTTKAPSPDKLWLSIPISVSLESVLDAIGVTETRERSNVQSYLSLEVNFMVTSSSKTQPEAPELSLHEYQSSGCNWLSKLATPFALPPWTRSSCLMDYLPSLTEKVQAALDLLAAKLLVKKLLFDKLFSIMGAPIEYNRLGSIAVFSLSASLDSQSLPVLIHVDASSLKFPDASPLLTVTNIRAMGIGEAGSTTYTDCPWSPRWPPEEMAARLLAFLKIKVPIFLKDPTSNRRMGFVGMLSSALSLGGFDSPPRGNSPPPASSPSRLTSMLGTRLGDDPS